MNIHYENLYWSYLKGHTICIEMLKTAQKYKNTLILDMFNLVIFLDVEFDDEDFYYVCSDKNKGIYRSSAVGTPIFLKDKLNKKEYNKLIRIWNLNYEEKAH